VLLHGLADASGWPKELVSQLSEALSPDYEVFVDYPAAVAVEIEDLEYGTSGSLPNAVIRPFKSRAHLVIEPVLERRTLTDIFRGLGII
jgi:hypothetical protein